MTTTTIPVIIETEEAKRRMANLKMDRELEMIADWMRTSLPGLYGIRVSHALGHSPVMANHLIFWADRYECEGCDPIKDLVGWDFLDWAFYALPFAICRSIIIWCTYQPAPSP